MALRQLGHAERYSTTRSDLGIYLNVGLTAHYHKRTRDGSLQLCLFYALAMLIARHPILSAIPMAVDTPSPYFVRLDQITLSEIVTFVEGNVQLDEFLEQQHNEPFDGNIDLPFWRVCVLESSEHPDAFTLVLIFHHALMDTKSALSFHIELEKYMAEDAIANGIDIVRPPDTRLLPPLEELHTLPITPEFLQSQARQPSPPHDCWTGSPQFLPVKTSFSSLWLSPAQTLDLMERAKEEHTSVTSALQVMIADCILSTLPPELRTLQADCAVSLRRFLPETVTDTSLGCYVGSFSVRYSRMRSLDWGEARRTKDITDRVMGKRGSDMPVGYLRFIPSLHAWMKQKQGRKRQSSFELSNIGKFPDKKRLSNFKIEGMLFSQSASACSAAIKISAVTGRDGRLALGFSWQKGVVENSQIQSIKRAFVNVIESLRREKK